MEAGTSTAHAGAIDMQALTCCFGDQVAVDSLTLRIPSGMIFGLLGSNGAGKSTVIKMLTTLLPPTAGSATVAGNDIGKDPLEVRRHTGYVSQMLSADGELSGYENLLMLHRPPVLFLDEPTVGLDPSARHGVWQRIRDLRQEFGITILMTTHDMEEADQLCEMLAFMHRGKLIAQGTPAGLKQQGSGAALDDVFIELTGASMTEREDYKHVAQVRGTFQRVE